jgi:hypothetical protein
MGALSVPAKAGAQSSLSTWAPAIAGAHSA